MNDWMEWLTSLEPEYLFLLALPFAVAALGLAAEALRRRSESPSSRTDARNAPAARTGNPLHSPH